MVTQLHQTTPEQEAHQRLRESVQRIVLDETQGGRRIVRSVVSIMEGDAPGSTPWHQLEAAKLLLKLGFEDARATLGSIHKQGRKDAPKSQDLAQTELGNVSEQPLGVKGGAMKDHRGGEKLCLSHKSG